MNEQSLAVPADEPAGAPAGPAAPRPGARLAAARAAQGLTVTDVARQLRLSPAQVEAIEADDTAKLPGPVFARGFVRNYARLVSLDPTILLDEGAPPPPRELAGPQVPPALGAAFPSRRAPGWSRYALLGALALTLAIAWQARRDEPVEIATAPVQPVVVETAVPPAAAETAPAPEAREPVAPASVAGERVLTLRFSDECWVEAVDRGGAKLVSQVYARGAEARIAAPGPFDVVLGNAAVARATLDDQPFDLAPHVKVNVARFTVQ